ncbi:type II toxin-antitoxin system RelE/ParE family toxin [Candidatus Roizmanbacteria bacterium]|nr:type II toxin-antitoxin system RelE/ParE family toxin [Candidatus Roizmanbacteria bacterium]
MNYDVFMSEDAEADILDIWKYVAHQDSVERANSLIDALQEACLSLCRFPDRGHCPPELQRVYVLEYRELHYKPYRIIYRILDRKGFIHGVLDGRRNLQDLLLERLIRWPE